jgi:hypothetical protein
MLVPLPAPQVPLGFPPRAAPVPSVPWRTEASGQTTTYTEAGSQSGCQGGQTAPYTEAGGPTTPHIEASGLTAWGPSAAFDASPDGGPPLCA